MKMDRSMERAYKRKCFQGRGWLARWLDKVFFSALCGICLFILCGSRLLSLLLIAGVLLLLCLLDRKRWNRFRHKLWQDAAHRLKREDWIKQEAEDIRRSGGTILFPTPDRDTFMGACLRFGPGTAFHSFGEPVEELRTEAVAFGCAMSFHPWGEGGEPSRERILERLRQDAPLRDHRLWRKLLHLPGNRYLLTGCLLLLLSVFLRKALYWRLLGSLCLLIGTFRRTFRMMTEA